MYTRAVVSIVAVSTVVVLGLSASNAVAQATPAHDMAHMDMGQKADTAPPASREGSGTSWLPDMSPMYAVHATRGAWQLMAHENAFVQYLNERGDRGHEQLGSINWLMGMAARKAGPGRVTFTGMISAEPWTIRGCGYPDLLASGERCGGEKIHDQQHPHDLFMELAAQYDAPLKGSLRWQVYGGPAGEPALGPVAFPHRVSAMPNPLAPLTHHWLDATHITFGVVTAGVYGRRWKAEGSVFNGREPDENRKDFDVGALDSFSGRLSFLPTPSLSLQVSSGKLTAAEPAEHGGAGIDVSRVTASATYHAMAGPAGIWATTVAWGRNEESGVATNALLAESNLTLNDRDTWFGRFEVVNKTAHDLDIAESDDRFLVAKLQGGYTRYLRAWQRFKPGLGASLSAGFVPESLRALYGGRVNPGVGVFATFRPAGMMMNAGQ